MEWYNIMSQVKEDQQVSSCQDLQQLRQRVHLSSNKLLQLTYNDNKYMDKLIAYNSQAKRLINEDLTEEAMVYLQQAERILEYGASCGKSIDRNIIVTTLHNEACCYYKQADLTTAAKYLQGLIFNLKAHLDSLQSSPASSGVDRKQTPDQDRKDPFLWLSLQKKMELVQYYLKFCTINSQAKRRDAALDAGKRVLQLSTSLFVDLQQDNLRLTACEDQSREAELLDLRRLLKEVRVFREQIQVGEVGGYVKVARWWIRQWNENKVIRKVSFGLEKHVSNYSISEVIDMVPIQYRPDDQHYDSYLNSRTILRQLLHFSMGYFTVSTQYRLIAEQLYKDVTVRTQSQEFQKANIYHLLAILFLTVNLNCDLLFMKQVISSYQHHFKTDLSSGDVDPQAQKIAQNLLFEPKRKEKMSAPLPKPKDKQKQKKKRLVSQYEDSYVYQDKVSMKMNTKMQQKLKRSLSKKNTLSSSKKLTNKIINQTLLQSSKNNGNRSRSISKNPPVTKIRSQSKDSSNVKMIVKQTTKVEKNEPKINKKTNDQYQLGQTKVVRKRLNSSSSADLSVSCRSRDFSKNKQTVAVKKKQVKGKAKPKPKVASKQVLNKHYYL